MTIFRRNKNFYRTLRAKGWKNGFSGICGSFSTTVSEKRIKYVGIYNKQFIAQQAKNLTRSVKISGKNKKDFPACIFFRL